MSKLMSYPATTPKLQRHDERAHRQAANRAVAVSALGLALTGGIELALALFTGSVALLGDALHNLADVSTSGVVFLGFYISKRQPTRTYPYGYERAEDIAGLGVALVIWLSALFAGYQSYQKLIGKAGTTHLAVGMAAAVVGMVGNTPSPATRRMWPNAFNPRLWRQMRPILGSM